MKKESKPDQEINLGYAEHQPVHIPGDADAWGRLHEQASVGKFTVLIHGRSTGKTHAIEAAKRERKI